jgi:hypothetical protein
MLLLLLLLQAGERGDREAAFYAAMQQHLQQGFVAFTAAGAHDPQAACASCSSEEQHALVQALAAWVPRSCEWRRQLCVGGGSGLTCG